MIRRDDIHVWRVDLRSTARRVAALGSLLADEERARAARFRFERHRARFIVGRAATRQIVGRYAALPPRAVTFEYGTHGKPGLAAGTGLAFNVSHSGDRAFVAVTGGRTVGGDIEIRRTVPDADAIARRFFNEDEAAWIRAAEEPEKSDAFLRLWTRKEAYVKAIGGGLSIPLDGVDVLDGAGGSGPVRAADAAAGTWTYRDIETWPDCLASVVTDGVDSAISIRDWAPDGAPDGGTERAAPRGAGREEPREVGR